MLRRIAAFPVPPMKPDFSWLRPLIIILILAVPAVSLKVLSRFFDNPWLQPLDLTKEGLTGSGDYVEPSDSDSGRGRIDVRIDWGRDRSRGPSRAQLKRSIAATLDARTDYYAFELVEVPGDGVAISFIVGPNSYGPFPPGGIDDGLSLALAALQMTRARR